MAPFEILISPNGDEITLNGSQSGTELIFIASSNANGSVLNKFNKIEAYFVFGEGQTKHVPLTFNQSQSQQIDIKDIAPPLFTKVGIFVSLEDDIISDGDLYETLTTNTLVFVFDGKTLADYGIVDAYTKTETNNLLDGKADKSEIPTKVSQLQNDSGYLTQHQDISGKADKSEIPTKVSQLQNDAGYLTQHQDISGKADKATSLAGYGIDDAYTKTEINNMIGDVETLLGQV